MSAQDATVLDEAECLRLIKEGDEFGPVDAADLIHLWKPNAIRRFRAVDKSLRGLLADVRTVFPDAQYYTASGGFHLMLGPAHAPGNSMVGQQQLIALSGRAQIGDGDF